MLERLIVGTVIRAAGGALGAAAEQELRSAVLAVEGLIPGRVLDNAEVWAEEFERAAGEQRKRMRKRSAADRDEAIGKL